ncbi:MAG: hypothetical protein JWP95_698 [Actinotalea sp.]|nr:hypothetical protein [Actinotalea sp.]
MARRTMQLTTTVATLGLVTTALLGGLLPTAAVEGTVTFTAAGDYAANTNTTAVLNRTVALDPDLTIALGDLSYGVTGAEQAWCDFVTQRVGPGFPFELIAGNHESNGQNGNINDFSACLPNQLPGAVGTYGRQWYVDVPAEDPLVRFVMISPALTFPDGTWQYTAGTARYAWTEGVIDGARAASIPWVVVSLHKPCLSLGDYTCDQGVDLSNLLLAKKVDLVLNGHEHLYQRTHQLGLRPGCTSLATGTADLDCIVDSDATMVRGAGTVFATVGTGGQTQRAVHTDDGEAPYFAAASGLATATWGQLDVDVTADTLTARFDRALGGSFTDQFTISQGTAANVPPTASFTAACNGLDCTFDAAGSSDPDGTLTGYAWDFGDGTTGTGATPTHRYAAAGTWTVGLTVTDDDGAIGSTTGTASTTAPVGPFAADAFNRTVQNGLGTADVGGLWRFTQSSSYYGVSGSTGNLFLNVPGRTLDVGLPDATSPTTDLLFSATMDKPATGGGVYLTVGARRVAGVGEYRANVRLRPNGVVALGLARTTGTAETAFVAPAVVPGLTLATGEKLMVRTQVVGSSPTVLRARVWRAGTTEPTTWQATATDSTAGLQAPGSIGFNVYLSSSVTNAPVTVRLDDLVASRP